MLTVKQVREMTVGTKLRWTGNPNYDGEVISADETGFRVRWSSTNSSWVTTFSTYLLKRIELVAAPAVSQTAEAAT